MLQLRLGVMLLGILALGACTTDEGDVTKPDPGASNTNTAQGGGSADAPQGNLAMAEFELERSP